MELREIVGSAFNMANESHTMFEKANHGGAWERLEELRVFLNGELTEAKENVTETDQQDTDLPKEHRHGEKGEVIEPGPPGPE